MSVASDLYLQVENEFNELRKAYTLFFSDQIKVEPFELREAVQQKIKRLRNLSNLRTEDQFRTNNIISKVQSHFQLWDRQLERKYQGGGRRPKRTTAQKTNKPDSPKKPENKSVMIRDAGSQRDAVVSLYDEYTRLNLLVGSRKMINFSKFQSFIKNQTEKIQTSKGAKGVRYEITEQDGKVVIKSKSVK